MSLRERTRPELGLIESCLPSPAKVPPSGPGWLHEINHDGFRLARDDFSGRFPFIAMVVSKLPVRSCLIDGEAIVCDENGLAVFELIRRHGALASAVLCAFDLLEVDGLGLRRQPIELRKKALAKLLKGSLSMFAVPSNCCELRGYTLPVGAPLRLALDEAARTKQSPIILLTSESKPWTPDGFRASWGKACKKAGIEQVTFNDLRGTAVTRLALVGCTEAEIAAITGHSVRSILDAHYLPRSGNRRDRYSQAGNRLCRTPRRSQNRNRIYKMTDKTVYRVQQQQEEKAKKISWLGN